MRNIKTSAKSKVGKSISRTPSPAPRAVAVIGPGTVSEFSNKTVNRDHVYGELPETGSLDQQPQQNLGGGGSIGGSVGPTGVPVEDQL